MNNSTYFSLIENIYLDNNNKKKIFLKRMNSLTKLHYKNSPKYMNLNSNDAIITVKI